MMLIGTKVFYLGIHGPIRLWDPWILKFKNLHVYTREIFFFFAGHWGSGGRKITSLRLGWTT
jgi:hypothetical protein